MLKLSLTMALVIGIGITGAVGQDYGAPRGYYNNGYGPQQAQGWPPNNQSNGQRYTTVTVTNRGQNGYPDQVVQQQVLCGSQYFDGYRQRIARC
ncbi:MAG: hypothetical protein Q8N51_09970 [Gammaproteobacteria bacterium]|nr:hypothetical protein [Gammaproteobacteria bacterium]